MHLKTRSSAIAGRPCDAKACQGRARIAEMDMEIFIQLSPTVTKLCHIKCDLPECVLVYGGHFKHIMEVALNMP